jgi:hypothetical protein
MKLTLNLVVQSASYLDRRGIEKKLNGDLQASKLHLTAPARTSFDVTNSNEVYEAHEILSGKRHKLIQIIIPSDFFLYKKIYHITNIALKNPKWKINIVKRHRGRSSNYFTCNPCGAPAKFGGDWRSPLQITDQCVSLF